MKKELLFLLCFIFSFYAHSQAPTNGLIAYWPLDGNYTDSGPNAVNGTNSASTATTNFFGETSKAVAFSNTNPTITVVNQYASHPNNANLNFALNQDFSIDFNAFIASPYIHGGGFYDYGNNTFGYGVWYWNQNGFLQLQFNFGNASVGTTNGALAYDTWQHITAIKTGNFIKIYINGVLNASANAGTSTPNYTSVNGTFGAMYFATFSPPQYNGCNGKMDELRIYNRALTDEEILALYQLNSLNNSDFNVQDDKLTFYPNPTKESISFSKSVTSIQIYDITGKQMNVSLHENKIDVSNLTKGIYLLKAFDIDGKIMTSGKFIRE